MKEELKVKYKPKSITCIRFTKKFENQESLSEAFEITNKSSKQQDVILSIIQSDRNLLFIKKQDILKSANVDASVIAALIKKGIVELYDRTISRLGTYEDDSNT